MNICSFCNWEYGGKALKRCPKCRRTIGFAASRPAPPAPPNIVGDSAPAPTAPFDLPITETIAVPPSNPGEAVKEEPLPEGVSAEQMADLKDSGPAGEALAGLAEGIANANPESITADEIKDMLIAVNELQCIPLEIVFDETLPSTEDPEVDKRLTRASRAGYRLFKRHPDWYKGKVADLIDGGILALGATGPLQIVALKLLKKKVQEAKQKKAAQNQAPPPTSQTPPQVKQPEPKRRKK